MLEIIAAKQPSILMERASTTVTMPHSQFKVRSNITDYADFIAHLSILI